ncbi:GntR family transcriptional regulator [Amycolatopsis sp. H20-H5]|uniref:GntR family transcriptional regulator n=1 Tax=Amycolatopsis sp. H20-H5 TaxID=3046309 RepID=UPI002DBAD3E8|nr:GntR family transcriptional regulator [Amycolatopsis sp. H20-H5]MEC3976236.1 GntR family transcriptional regulator [Amycolatopsis sp. H20-H5]
MNGTDLDDPRPSYLRVADALRKAIQGGDLAAGDQLPTHRALADQYDVAVETAKRALGLLRNDGLIVTRPGKGSFVRRGPNDVDDSEAEQDLTGRVNELTREVEDLKGRLAAVEARLPD